MTATCVICGRRGEPPESQEAYDERVRGIEGTNGLPWGRVTIQPLRFPGDDQPPTGALVCSAACAVEFVAFRAPRLLRDVRRGSSW